MNFDEEICVCVCVHTTKLRMCVRETRECDSRYRALGDRKFNVDYDESHSCVWLTRQNTSQSRTTSEFFCIQFGAHT